MRLDQTDRVKLGERIRGARQAVGLTQEQVAKGLNVARTTLVAIESGERQVRAEELVALASLFGLSTNALLRDTAVHVNLVGQFRKNTGVEESAALETLRLLNKLASSCAELERRLGHVHKYALPAERTVGRGPLEAQAEDLALELRNHLGVGISPIPDVISLLELELGVRVFIRGLPSKISGVSAYHPEVGACVLINSKHRPERQVWTAAHETLHLLVDRNSPEVCYDDGGAKSPSERLADFFAAAFLMPGAAVRRHHAEAGRFSARELILMAKRFHVSIEAMCRRLEQLKLVAAGTYERLQRQGISNEVVRQVLGDDPSQRALPPPRLTMLAVEAFSKGLLTEGQVSDMLAIDRIAVREMLDALGDDLASLDSAGD